MTDKSMRNPNGRDHHKNLYALGEAIRTRRVELVLSQEEIGLRAGLHRTYVTEIENGLRNMSLVTLLKVCSALEISLSALIIEAERVDGWELMRHKKAGNNKR